MLPPGARDWSDSLEDEPSPLIIVLLRPLLFHSPFLCTTQKVCGEGFHGGWPPFYSWGITLYDTYPP